MRLLIWGFAACSCLLAEAAPVEVTYHKTIAPILQARCQGCHRPGEAVPMALLTYKDARAWAKAIKEAVLLRKMPPWFADPAHGDFVNDRRLSKEEIDAITAWVDGGAKEGSPADAPPPRTFTEGWSIGKPDLTVQMPQPFDVPASGTVEYTYFVVPTGFTEDQWVQATEARPTNRAVVHHIVVFVRPPGSKFLADAPTGVAYVPASREPRRQPDTGEGSLQYLNGVAELIGGYAPGSLPSQLKPGQARLVPKGSDLIFQMHYTPNGKPATDQSRIGFILAKEPPKERVINTFIADTNLHIPPESADFIAKARVTFYEQATLLSLAPHMHLRGKSFEYRATYPTGETETLLTVPRYDFNWQLSYNLKQPKVLPKGTVIECIAHYDNSANNPVNPNPKSDVFWGDQTWDEMLAGFLDLAVPVNMNTRDIAVPRKTAPPAAN